MQAPSPAPSKPNNTLIIVIILVLAVVVVCCLIPFCVIAILALLGPQIGNVFSQVTRDLQMIPPLFFAQ